jgi:mono/diheme cytochrome c family protein
MTTLSLGSRPFQLIVLLLACVLLGAGCGSSSDDEGGSDDGAKSTATADDGDAEKSGKDLFVNSCGSCHTLSDAGTSGTVGPSLDDLKPTSAETLTMINKGGGAMPAGILAGEDAEAVADYVGSLSK